MVEVTKRKKLMLVGNPNVGKSVIFRWLTKRYAMVSNYPGTTVEIARGQMRLGSVEYEVIDTPGINSLVPQSEDERVTCEMLLREKPDVIVQVADAKNLRRTLLVTWQLCDLGVPLVLVLNLADEAQERGIEIDAPGLAELFQIPVVETVATYGHGLRHLLQAIQKASVPRKPLEHGPCLTEARKALGERAGLPLELAIEWLETGDAGFAREVQRHLGSTRTHCLQAALQCHQSVCHRPLYKELTHRREQFLNQAVTAFKRNQQRPLPEETAAAGTRIWLALLCVGLVVLAWGEIGGLLGVPTPERLTRDWLLTPASTFAEALLSAQPLRWIHALLFGMAGQGPAGYGLVPELIHLLWLVAPVVVPVGVLMRRSRRFTTTLGLLTRQASTGIPILLVVLLLVYEFVGYTGAQTLVGLLEDVVFGTYLVPWMQALIPPGFFYDLLVGPYGLISMGLTYAIAIVLPVVGTFFIAFGLLEDSGYLPRLAVLSDRLLRLMGMNGKAVLPMVLGLGCDTMATMTTRILNTPKERLIATLLLALGVPCSAQLGVILGLAAGFSAQVTLMVLLIVASQLVLVGYLSARLIRGSRGDFIFEIPPIRVPLLRNVMLKTGYRLKWFLGEVVPLFLWATLALFILDQVKLGTQSGLQWMEEGLRPIVVGWLHLPVETAQTFVMGFLRRDYGAAGLFDLARDGGLTAQQAVVSLTVITLFVPCLANFLVIIKEQGWKRALAIVGFITPFALAVGGVVSWVLRTFKLLAS
ncbi:MAG: ferrous iron transporter B [Blastocatellia bacterium]|nr:ferrous iron transporter B [Blastocatellia bacterium]